MQAAGDGSGARQSQGSVDDDFLTKRRRYDLVGTAEGREDVGIDQTTDRREPQGFSDQRDASSQDDPARSQQSDGLAEGERQSLPRPAEDLLRLLVPVTCRRGN